MRCWSRSKLGRPSASNATISPSSTAVWELSALLSGLTSGYCAVMSFRLRLSSRSRPGSEYAIARTPSHLISYAQPSSFAGSCAEPRHHRDDVLGHRLARRVDGRVHPVDQPVLLAPPGLEERVAALAAARRGRSATTLRGSHLCELVGAACPRSSSCPRRSCPPGSGPRTSGTRAGGPRCARPCGSRRGPRGCRWGPPTTRARRRARGAGPSAAAWRGAPGRRSAAGRPARRRSAPGSGVRSKSRLRS